MIALFWVVVGALVVAVVAAVARAIFLSWRSRDSDLDLMRVYLVGAGVGILALTGVAFVSVSSPSFALDWSF
ncbi:hypothetical protein ALI44B_00265 [Leifsonia sp. ALI-44-B]|nr:hypothetical protein ALI44B_00265 [Leifsonia sp. ALI-44-B]